MTDLIELTNRIPNLATRAKQFTGHEPREVHISFEDYANLEKVVGVDQVYQIGNMVLVPDDTVRPGSCRIEVF